MQLIFYIESLCCERANKSNQLFVIKSPGLTYILDEML